MNKFGVDPKVKKTLVRNCEQKVKPSARKPVVRDVDAGSSNALPKSSSSQKENELSQPTLCSSDALANYLSDVKKTAAPPLSSEDLNVHRGELCVKMTKKLNFHFNDTIYKNLIELNTSIQEYKARKEKRPTSAIKKDLEPEIEDFCEDEKETDSPPKIPLTKPKFKSIKKVEDGNLHKLVASFEVL